MGENIFRLMTVNSTNVGIDLKRADRQMCLVEALLGNLKGRLVVLTFTGGEELPSWYGENKGN